MRRELVARSTISRLLALMVACCLAGLAGAIPAAEAAPVVPVVNAEGGIYWRSAPEWNAAIQVVRHGVYNGDQVELECYERGGTVPPYYNNPLWYQARVVSGFGLGEGLVNDHFLNTGVNVPNIVVSGVPACGSSESAPTSPGSPPAPETAPSSPGPAPESAPSGTTHAEQAAINWARSFADSHSGRYHNLCLSFVFDAYSAAGVNLRPWVTTSINSNTYPVDIWNHFSHGHTGTGTPPPGALVFYSSTHGREYSHVTLSIGGGREVSTSDSVNGSTIHYETVSQHLVNTWSRYQGWWLPDA
jgi:hypothetical protein